MAHLEQGRRKARRRDVLLRGLDEGIHAAVKRRAEIAHRTVAETLEGLVRLAIDRDLRAGHLCEGEPLKTNVSRAGWPTIAVEEDVRGAPSNREMRGRLWWAPEGREMRPLPWAALTSWSPWGLYDSGRPVFITFDEGARFWKVLSLERSGEFVHARLEFYEPDEQVNAHILREAAALAKGMGSAPAGTAARMVREDRDRAE